MSPPLSARALLLRLRAAALGRRKRRVKQLEGFWFTFRRRTHTDMHTRTHVCDRSAFPSGPAESHDLSQAPPPASRALSIGSGGCEWHLQWGTVQLVPSSASAPSAWLPDGGPGRHSGVLSLLSQRQQSESGSEWGLGREMAGAPRAPS